MFDKSFLVNEIVKSLLSKRFKVFLSKGCFDVAAKKDSLILIKTLINVDGLNPEQALSLRAISYFVSAFPLVVSMKTNREFLNDEVIYSRFQLPVMTLKMFESMMKEEVPCIQTTRGKHTVTIDASTLRKKREELNLTLKELSELVDISKKALYEIENQRVNPTIDTVKKLESFFEVDLKTSYHLKHSEPTYLKPKDDFRDKVCKEFNRIGIDNSSVYSAPFEIVGKEKVSLITGLSRNTVRIKKDIDRIKKISSVFSSQSIFVVKKLEEKGLEGVPIFLDSELSDIDSVKEFKKMIKERVE